MIPNNSIAVKIVFNNRFQCCRNIRAIQVVDNYCFPNFSSLDEWPITIILIYHEMQPLQNLFLNILPIIFLFIDNTPIYRTLNEVYMKRICG